MLARSLELLCAYAGNRRGNVAVIFSLCAVPIITIVSGAIDYGRTFKVRSLVQNAADAAVHAARSKILGDESEVRRVLRAHLDANLPDHLKGLPFNLRIASDRRSLDIDMETAVPTTLMAMVGVSSISVVVTGHAALPTLPKAIGQPSVEDVQRAFDGLSRGSAAPAAPMAPAQINELMRGLPDPSRLSREDIERLRNSEEMRRAAAEMEARVRAALEGHGARGGVPDLGRLLGR